MTSVDPCAMLAMQEELVRQPSTMTPSRANGHFGEFRLPLSCPARPVKWKKSHSDVVSSNTKSIFSNDVCRSSIAKHVVDPATGFRVVG